MNDVLFFACHSISLSKVNGRKPCDLRTAARHNLREIQAEMGAIGRINPRQSVKNHILTGPDTAEGVDSLAKNIAAGAGVDLSKKRRDRCQAIELVFSLPEKSNISPLSFFDDCLKWATRTYKLPVLGAVVHFDEALPHCHVLMLPLEDGRYVGSAPVAKPKTRDNTELFFNQVAGPYGLKRQSAKLMGQAKQAAIVLVLAKCESNGLSDAAGPLWRFIEAAIRQDPTTAIRDLGISLDDVRATLLNPIGIESGDSKPIGIDKPPPEHQTLSCVGIEAQASQDEAINASVQANNKRLEVAMQAQQQAIIKHSCGQKKRVDRAVIKTRDDGLTVVQCDTDHISAWTD